MELRSIHEIEHGKMLSAQDTELLWGWGTPAGKIRAKRRANLIAEGAGLFLPWNLDVERDCLPKCLLKLVRN